MSHEWFDYGGETTEELLALGDRFRTDSLVLAFEQAIQAKAEAMPISRFERFVLAVEGLEREVNNGGYHQFLTNSSHEFVDVIEEALAAIGCLNAAAITHDALAALGAPERLTAERAQAIADAADEELRGTLGACDGRYYDNGEPIADRLFAWIGRNAAAIRVPG